ncbi:MAG: hypothetical protein OEY43_02470 [Gammaproteobacteria bacterium]|nr:hypothetical protein [Gammaproteobacteria bacterium]
MPEAIGDHAHSQQEQTQSAGQHAYGDNTLLHRFLLTITLKEPAWGTGGSSNYRRQEQQDNDDHARLINSLVCTCQRV